MNQGPLVRGLNYRSHTHAHTHAHISTHTRPLIQSSSTIHASAKPASCLSLAHSHTHSLSHTQYTPSQPEFKYHGRNSLAYLLAKHSEFEDAGWGGKDEGGGQRGGAKLPSWVNTLKEEGSLMREEPPSKKKLTFDIISIQVCHSPLSNPPFPNPSPFQPLSSPLLRTLPLTHRYKMAKMHRMP